MAHNRLERIGTIYTRVTGLIRSGAMKLEDRPLWYEIYQAFPPVTPARYDNPAPKVDVQAIFYPEDVLRGPKQAFPRSARRSSHQARTLYRDQVRQFYQKRKSLPAVDLTEEAPSPSQLFLETCHRLAATRGNNARPEELVEEALSLTFSKESDGEKSSSRSAPKPARTSFRLSRLMDENQPADEANSLKSP